MQVVQDGCGFADLVELLHFFPVLFRGRVISEAGQKKQQKKMRWAWEIEHTPDASNAKSKVSIYVDNTI